MNCSAQRNIPINLFDKFRSTQLQQVFGVSGLQLRATIVLVIVLGFGLVLPRLRNSDQPNIDLDAWSEETSTLRSKVAEIESHWKAKSETETEKGTDAFFRVNINVANEEELIKLPGIGPELAERILEYRNTNGGFSVIEDLSNVKGIGTKKIKKIRPFVVLN